MATRNPYTGVDKDIAKLIGKRKKTGEDVGRLLIFYLRELEGPKEEDDLERLRAFSYIIMEALATLEDTKEGIQAFDTLKELHNSLDRMTDRRKSYEQQFYHGIYRMFHYLDNATDYLEAIGEVEVKNPLFVTEKKCKQIEEDIKTEKGIAKHVNYNSIAYNKVRLGGKLCIVSDEDAKTYGNGEYIDPERTVLLTYKRWSLPDIYQERQDIILGLRNKVILPALRYLYGHYTILTIIEQIYKIKDLAFYLGTNTDEIEEYIKEYRRMTGYLETAIGERKDLLKIAKELFLPIEPTDYTPSKKVIRNIKSYIAEIKNTEECQQFFHYRTLDPLVKNMYMREK